MSESLAVKKTESLAWLKTAFEQNPSSCQGGALLEQFRRQQFAEFERRGLPTRREEAWKYTDVSFFEKSVFELPQPIAPDLLAQGEWQRHLKERARHSLLMVFVNGHYAPQFSTLSGLPEGVIINSLRHAIDSHVSLLNPYLFNAIDAQRYPFASLNAAFFSDGLFVYLPRSVSLDKPLHVLSLSHGQEGAMIHPRHLIILENDTALTLTEEYRSAGGEHYFMNVAVDGFLGRDASLNYYKIQNEAPTAKHIANYFFYQKQNSKLNACSFTTGGQLSRQEVTIRLQEPHASCRAKGFYGLDVDGQLIDHHVDVDHAAAYTQSAMDYRGVLAKQSRAVFNGRVHVRPEGKKTQAQQFNHNLLLSPLSEINTKPELEIYADDVQCRHGATTGQLDEDSLFYLCARGLERSEAVTLLLQAFVEAVLDEVTLPWLVEMMQAEWGRHLTKP